MISSQINETSFYILCCMIHISQTGPCSFQGQIFTCSKSTVSPNTIFLIQNNTLLFKSKYCWGTYVLLPKFNVWYSYLKPFSWAFFLEIHIHICAKPNYKWYLDLSWTVHCYIGWTNILYDTPFPRFPEVAFLLECHLGWCSGCGNKLDGVNRIDKPTRSANCAYRVLIA